MDKLLERFNGDKLAADAIRGKYLDEGENSLEDLFDRITDAILPNYIKTQKLLYPNSWKNQAYRKVNWRDELFGEFNSLTILPQGSILSNLGTKKLGSLSNCFVIGQPADSYGGIMQKDEQLVHLMKRRGGVGLDISTLRFSGAITSNTAKSSTGATSFMSRFSNSTNEVAQNGRRGALMLSMHCNHIDILDFIHKKIDNKSISGANISVKFTNEFMDAVIQNKDHILRFPYDVDIKGLGRKANLAEYNELIEHDNGIFTKRVKAAEIYKALAKSAWTCADPGQLFEDIHHEYSPDSVYPQYRGVTTNPCGEIFMQAFDACRLIAQNLLKCVSNPYTAHANINYDRLFEVSREVQIINDIIVDLEIVEIKKIIDKIKSDPEDNKVKRTELELWQNILEVTKSGRRTGSGITALGDMLAALNVQYGSRESFDIVERVFRTKLQGELTATIGLAEAKGPFKGWDKNLEYEFDKRGRPVKGKNQFYQNLLEEFPDLVVEMCKHGRRNVSWSTVAPTGTISLMAQVTSGVEPLFSPYYMRKRKVNPSDNALRFDSMDEHGVKWVNYPVLHPQLKIWAEINRGVDFNEQLDINSSADIEAIYNSSPWFNACANDIHFKNRISMQAIIQKYTTHSISSTLNLHKDVTVAEIEEIYLLAYKTKLKGVTVYRDTSKNGVLEHMNKVDSEEFKENNAPKRPKVLKGEVYKTTVKGVPYTVVIGLKDNKPYEIFCSPDLNIKDSEVQIKKVKRGEYNFVGDSDIFTSLELNSEEEEVIARLISGALRHGMSSKFIQIILDGSSRDLTGFSKAISRVLKKYTADGDKVTGATCSNCGSESLVFEEGCQKCLGCLSSKC
jgi:ribonucleoside-diphosphate reductase alpha chain